MTDLEKMLKMLGVSTAKKGKKVVETVEVMPSALELARENYFLRYPERK